MIDVASFEGGAPGPNLLFLGGVHGDEKPGILALDRLAAELEQAQIRLAKGRLRIIARVNAAAVTRNVRAVEENLNRIVSRHPAPKTHEQRLANELVVHLDAADAILDLHATSAPTEPFVFLDDEAPELRAWAHALGTRFVLTGWRTLYPGSQTPTTTDYALDRGKLALTMELGLQSDLAAAEAGYRASLQTLSHFGLLGPPLQDHAAHDPPAPASPEETPRHLELTQVVHREREGALAQAWQNFDFVPGGTAVARYADGTTLVAGDDAYIVMPNAGAKIGDEWFYLASLASLAHP